MEFGTYLYKKQKTQTSELNEKNNDWSDSKMNKKYFKLDESNLNFKVFVNKTMIFINKLFSWEHCFFCLGLILIK